MGNVMMLKEAMNTRFIINSLTQRFMTCLTKAEQEGLTIDVNGCRFGPECASLMQKYCGKIDFCNTEDPYLDAVLKNNCEVARQILVPYTKLDLKVVESLDDVVELANTLDKDTKYTPEVDLANIRSKAALTLLIMIRPDIEWDLTQCASDIFDIVRDLWIANAEHHDQYWELVAPNVVMRSINENGLYGDRSYGFMKESEFIRARTVLPIEFGTSQIVTLGKGKSSDEWIDTVKKCVNLFDTVKKEKRLPGKTVKDFLTFREG